MPRPPRIRSANPSAQSLQMADGSESKVEHKDQIFQHMQDIFKNQIEADVIHMVLDECDWEEEKSMDMLLSICPNCFIQTREISESDLALIACSLIDEKSETADHSDLEVGAVASSLPIIPEPILLHTNDHKHNLKLLIENHQKENSSFIDKLCENSPTEDINIDLTSPLLTEDVKDITLQSYMSMYLDDLYPNAPSQNVSILKDDDKTNCDLKPVLTQTCDGRDFSDKKNCHLKLLTHDGHVVNDKTNCQLKPTLIESYDEEVNDKTNCQLNPLLIQCHDVQEDNANLVVDNRNSSLDTGVIDSVVSTGVGNQNMCPPDKSSADTISPNIHYSSDTHFVTDEISVHNPMESKILKKNGTLENTSDVNGTCSMEKLDVVCSQSHTSEKIDESSSSSEISDLIISSSLGENGSVFEFSPLGNKAGMSDLCSTIKSSNSDENSQSCKTTDIFNGGNLSSSHIEDYVSEKSPESDSLTDKSDLQKACGLSVHAAHLSPNAPEFIPSFKQPSQKPYVFEGNPVFFTPKGPKYRCRNKTPSTCIPPHYSYQPGVVDHRHRLPLNQIMLKPIPVTSLESETFPKLSGKPSSVFSSSGKSTYKPESVFSSSAKSTSKPESVLSTVGNGAGTHSSQPLYSHATIKNPNGSIVTSQNNSSCSKKSSVPCSMASDIKRVKKYLDHNQLLMIILRGLPGSGKSTVAKELKFDGVVLTTDDYFMQNGFYEFDVNMLSAAHAWTKTRAIKAMEKKISPVIIDNTNTQLWEMIPYVKLALTYNYEIEIIEPNTPWKGKPAELAKRNSHGVTKEVIKRMKQRYEYNITVKSIIASVNDSDMIEKPREVEDLQLNTKTNDLSLPNKKQSKEPHILTPAPLKQPKKCSSYTTLLKSQNQGRGHLVPKLQKGSSTKNKLKDAQRQTRVGQQKNNLPSDHENLSINLNDKDYQSGFEKPNIAQDGCEKPNIQFEEYQAAFGEHSVQNEEYGDFNVTNIQNGNYQGGFQKSNIVQNKDYSAISKKPNCFLTERDGVISTLEDFLKQGDVKNMTDEDWKRRKDELDVLLQISPIDPNEREEISHWLGYRMKQMRGFNGLSENESDDNIGSVRSLTADYNSGFQKNHVENKFKSLSKSTDIHADVNLSHIQRTNKVTEEDIVNNLTDKRANSNNKQCSGLLNGDITIESTKTVTCLYPLNVDNSTRTNSKTNLSGFNLNSDSKHKEMKMSKQKDITCPLLDVSSFMDFSENKESMIAKKQEVYDKAIVFTENLEQDVSDDAVTISKQTSAVNNESCSLGASRSNCDTSSNIFLSEVEMDNKPSSPVSKDYSATRKEETSVSSSKPKRERKKKHKKVSDRQMFKNDKNFPDNSRTEISAVPKIETDHWASSLVKNAISGECTVEEETISWNLECQKPKPQRIRRQSERSISSSENGNCEKVDTDNIEMMKTEIEEQSVQADKKNVTDIVEEDLLNDVQQDMDVKRNHDANGDQVNISDTELNTFGHGYIEKSHMNLNEPDQSLVSDNCSSVKEDPSESDGNCEDCYPKLAMSTGIWVTKHESDESAQEPVISKKVLMNDGKTEGQDDDSTGICFVTQENEKPEEPGISSQEMMDADVVKTQISDSTEKISKKSKSKHKKGGIFSSPFLHISDKQKFVNLNWRNFDPIQGPCSNVVNTEIKENKKVSCRTHWTLTTANDFNVIDSLNRGFNVSSIKNADKYKILLGKGRFLNQTFANKSKCNADDCISTKLPLDKSTMTEDFQNNIEQDIEFLKHSFPDISEHQLCEVLTMCQNDVEWSVNLLLDWGVSVPLSPVDKQEITEEMLKLKIVSPGKGPQHSLLPSDQSSSSPLPLFDLCWRLINSKHLVTLKELEERLIKDSYKRLQRMESHGIERMLSISYDESLSLAEMDDCQESTKDVQKETASNGSLSSSSSESDLRSARLGLGAAASEILSGEEAISRARLFVEPTNSGSVDKKSLLSGIEMSSGHGIKAEGDAHVVIRIPRNMVEVLESLFGPAESRLEAEDEFDISLDLDTAKLLHSCLQRRRMPSKSVLKQLMDDEAMARRLQQEEKFGCVKPHYQHSGGLVIEVEPHYQRGGVIPVRQTKNQPPVKLMDIMKEEKDKHILMVEQQKVLEEYGDHVAIATKLKRQKLYHVFPGVDENFLEEIFQANGFNLEDTVCVIQNCLGSKDTGKSVIANDMSAEIDGKLLEQARQHSSQPLISGSLNLQNERKEFQNIPDETDSLPSYSELRAEGTLHHQLRDDCFSKAQQAYRRGMKDVAYFYSQQGHLHIQKMKEAHMRASQKLLESRNDMLEQQSTLDLHGFHVNEAISTLKHVLEQRETEFQIRPDRRKQSLVIVTGKGRHSQGGVAKVRPAVANFLNNAGYRFTENQIGIFKVQLRYRPTV